MNSSRFVFALLLALPLAAAAQTKATTTTTRTKATTQAKPTVTAQPVPVPQPVADTAAPQQVTEVTEDLDPATGKVIRRTTRTTTLPASTTNTTAPVAAEVRASDAQVATFLREKIVLSTLSAPVLLTTYTRFMDRVHADRHGWNTANWSAAAAVLASLNARYEQVRANFSLDDKVTIRSQQAEFQALRTARQLSDQVSDKL